MARGKPTVLVESAAARPGAPKECLTQLQALRVDGASVHASEHTDTVAACPPFRWDQKLFTGLFRE